MDESRTGGLIPGERASELGVNSNVTLLSNAKYGFRKLMLFPGCTTQLNTYPVRWMQHGPRPPRFQHMSTERLLAHTQNTHKGKMNHRRTIPSRRRSIDACDTGMRLPHCGPVIRADLIPGGPYIELEGGGDRAIRSRRPALQGGYVTWYVYGTKPCSVGFTFLYASFVSFLRRLQRWIG